MIDFVYPEGNYPAREWHVGWLGIDTDEHIEEEQGNPSSDLQPLSDIKTAEDYVDPFAPPHPKNNKPKSAKPEENKKTEMKFKAKSEEKVVNHEVGVRFLQEWPCFRVHLLSRSSVDVY